MDIIIENTWSQTQTCAISTASYMYVCITSPIFSSWIYTSLQLISTKQRRYDIRETQEVLYAPGSKFNCVTYQTHSLVYYISCQESDLGLSSAFCKRDAWSCTSYDINTSCASRMLYFFWVQSLGLLINWPGFQAILNYSRCRLNITAHACIPRWLW